MQNLCRTTPFRKRWCRTFARNATLSVAAKLPI